VRLRYLILFYSLAVSEARRRFVSFSCLSGGFGGEAPICLVSLFLWRFRRRGADLSRDNMAVQRSVRLLLVDWRRGNAWMTGMRSRRRRAALSLLKKHSGICTADAGRLAVCGDATPAD